MTLVVENGSGLANAESYASIASADAYLTLFGTPDSWTAATTGEKEIALRKATRYLEATYAGEWPGCVKSRDQALSWPRWGAERSDGVCIDSSVVPTAIVQATAYMAAVSLDEDILPDTTGGGISSESLKAGPIEKSVTYLGEKPVFKQYSTVEGLLAMLVGIGNGMIRVERG
jgi:hypothetical protein